MNWTLRRAKKDGRLIFAKAISKDECEFYVPSSGDGGKVSARQMKQNSSYIMVLCEADNKMVEETVNESS